MKKRLPKWLWITLLVVGLAALGFVDWLTGYELNFFLFYFLPISIGAWYLGLKASAGLAVVSALVWLAADLLSGHVPLTHVHAVWNTTIRLVSFLAIGWSVSRMRHALDQERCTAESLRQALSEIKVLEGFLPICAQCKKIRDGQGVWQPLEVYIGEHSDAQFSHSYCPECARKVREEAGLIGKQTA